MKYKKKPVVIEAVQVTDSTFDGPHPNPEHVKSVEGSNVVYNPVNRKVYIQTLEGVMIAEIGDWIITGVQGERYPCKPDIFEATHKKVTEPACEECGGSGYAIRCDCGALPSLCSHGCEVDE